MDSQSEKVQKLKYGHKRNLISDETFREEILRITVKEMKLECTEPIARGMFGDVIPIILSDRDNGVAVKIVLSKQIGLKEKEWKKLQHKNILPLLFTEDISQLDVQLFVTSLQAFTLEDLLKDHILFTEPVRMLSRWIEEVTSALDYMHNNGFCHLNLKSSNVLISEDMCAKVFDFHWMSSCDFLTMSYDISSKYRPPESFAAGDEKAPVEGKAFDIWCLGMLVIEMCSKNYIKKKTANGICSWSNDIYPKIFAIIQKKKFNKNFIRAFPMSCLQKDTRLSLINFATGCLRFHPEKRPTAKELLDTLMDPIVKLKYKDDLWRKRVKAKTLKQKIKGIYDVYLNENNMSQKVQLELLEPKVENLIPQQNDTSKEDQQVENCQTNLPTITQNPIPAPSSSDISFNFTKKYFESRFPSDSLNTSEIRHIKSCESLNFSQETPDVIYVTKDSQKVSPLRVTKSSKSYDDSYISEKRPDMTNRIEDLEHVSSLSLPIRKFESPTSMFSEGLHVSKQESLNADQEVPIANEQVMKQGDFFLK